MINTSKIGEVHSEITLAPSLEAVRQDDKDSAYRQECHREIKAGDDRQLFHTLVLIGAYVMVSRVSSGDFLPTHQ